jgi:hypothetical protein
LQLRGAHRLGRVGLKDFAGYEGVEKAPESGEVLLHRSGRPVVLFDVGGDVDRLNIG